MTAIAYSGSGTLAPCHVGAWHALAADGITPDRVSGTSGGSLVAGAQAFGYTPAEARQITADLLSPTLLDRQWAIWRGYGLHRGDRLRDAIREVLPGRLGDAKIPLGAWVVRVDDWCPLFLDSATYPDLPVADVLAASCSIPLFFSSRSIPHLRGRYVDGGVVAQHGIDPFVAFGEPTIAIRIRAEPRSYPPRHVVDYVAGCVGALMSSSSHVDWDPDVYPIDIATDEDALEFDLSKSDIDRRFEIGYRAAVKALLG